MAAMQIGNAPCSWGTLEFENVKAEQIGYSRMLDELVETGYTGTELGDWGYMPTEPSALRPELSKRKLVMLGAFVPVALRNSKAHEEGIQRAVRTAKLLAAVGTDPKPVLVLADENGTVPERTKNAGRITEKFSLDAADWSTFAAGANAVGRAVRDATGLATVFHHHCAGFVETPPEIAKFLELTDPELVNLVFDTGHYAFGSAESNVLEGMERFRERIHYIHLKDCDPAIAKRSRTDNWDYFDSVRNGVFCELGKGCVDFPAVLQWLKKARYESYLLVEQDVLPGMGSPKESARRNREYLRSIEHYYA